MRWNKQDPETVFSNLRFNRGKSAKASPVEGGLAYAQWMLFLSSAAALFLVMWMTFGTGQQNPNKGFGPLHFSDGNKDFLSKCRYVGTVGELGIIECPKNGGGTEQVKVKVGQEFHGYTIKDINKSQIEFQGDKEELLFLKLKGALIDGGKPVEPGPDIKGNDGITAFVIQGTVYDGEGKPAPGADVSIPRNFGWPLRKQADTNGHYSITVNSEVTSVRTRYKGLSWSVQGKWNSDATVDLNLSKIEHFTLQGTVKDEAGNVITSANIEALGEGDRDTVAHAEVDDKGNYKLVATRKITSLRVNLSWFSGNTFDKMGPWEASATVDLLLPADKYFAIEGVVSDKGGANLSGVRVTLYAKEAENGGGWGGRGRGGEGDNGGGRGGRRGGRGGNGGGRDGGNDNQDSNTQDAPDNDNPGGGRGGDGRGRDGFRLVEGSAQTDSAGHYLIYSNREIIRVVASFGSVNVEVKGTWTKNSTVNLSLKDANAFTLRGTVTDEAGKGIKGLNLGYQIKGEDNLNINASTDEAGNYVLVSEKEISRVLIRGTFNGGSSAVEIVRNGAWKEDGKLDISLKGEGIFKLDGKLLNTKGEPVAKADVWAVIAEKEYVRARGGEGGFGGFGGFRGPNQRYRPSVETNGEGSYQFYSSVTLDEIGTEYDNFNRSKKGPWKTSATVSFDMSKEKILVIEGYVVKGKDQPLSGVSVRLRVQGTRFSRFSTRTDDKGYFKFSADDTVESLLVEFDDTPIVRNGPFKSGQIITVDVSAVSRIELSGKVLDQDGKGVRDLRVEAFDANGTLLNLGETHRDGSYKFFVTSKVEKIQVMQFRRGEAPKVLKEVSGSWNSDSKIDDIQVQIEKKENEGEGENPGGGRGDRW